MPSKHPRRENDRAGWEEGLVMLREQIAEGRECGRRYGGLGGRPAR